jgi:diguanylate cyclase (GGDEF)-like protein
MLLMSSLDLGTVLILYMTSLLAGTGTLLLVWLRAARPPGVAAIATAFFLLAIGAFLAGLGEIHAIPAFVWRDSSAGLGAGSYALLFLGVRRLDRPVGRFRWLLLSAPALLMVGAVLPVFADNTIRATVFHTTAATASLAAGLSLLGRRRIEPLASRVPLALTFLVCGTVYGLQIPLLVSGLASPASVALGFSATMMMNFAIAALLVSFVRERREEVHRRVSVTDPLTRVFNRQGFLTLVPGYVEAGAAIALFDLDHFKRVNDQFGHAGGDHTLTCFARLVDRHLLKGEILARVGGEEFVVYWPDGGGSVRRRVEDICIATRVAGIHWQNAPIPISVSVGLVQVEDGHPRDRETLLALADAALYAAKAAGRNRVVLAPPGRLAA